MKKLVTSIFMSICIFYAHGQENEFNFKAIEGIVIWQKVFDNEMNQDEIIQKLINSGIFSDYVITEDGLTGNLRMFDPDYKAAGFTFMQTTYVIKGYHHSGYVSVNFKENRYRVTVNRFTLSKQCDDALGKQGEIDYIETYAFNNQNELSKTFFKYIAPVYDYSLTKMFTPLQLSEEDGNW
jgi:hypothetical protein